LKERYTSATCCADEQLVAGNKQHVAGNKLLVARNKQLVARNLLPRNMLRWCKRGLTVCLTIAMCVLVGSAG